MSTTHRIAPWLPLALLALALAVPAAGGTAVRPESTDLASRVLRAAARAATDSVAAPDRFEIVSSRFGGADRVAGRNVGLELVEVVGPNASGMVRTTFRLVQDGIARGRASATVRGRVRGPVLTADRLLQRGAVIGADDVSVNDADLTRLTAKPLRSPEQAIGLVPVRSLGAGRELTSALLAPAPLVRRGQKVPLRIENDWITIRVEGRALRDGTAGEVVPAQNAASGARVVGTVQPDGSLLVRSGGS